MINNLGIIIHYVSIVLSVTLTSLGVGFGGGLASIAALKAINIAPSTKNNIFTNLLICLALIETGAIIGLIMAIILLNQPTNVPHILYISLAELGIALAVGISGFMVGISSAFPAQQAFLSIARQPFFSGNITNMLLITQSIIQTPVIFGFLISLLIKAKIGSVDSLENGIRLLAAGFAIGVGSIGPAIGLSRFGRTALQSLGMNRNSYKTILPFAFISQAIIETPIIFVMLISMILTLSDIGAQSSPTTLIAFCAAAIGIAISTYSPGISSARVASSACTQMALNPESSSEVSKISILGQGLIDTCAIYGLLITLLIIIFK